MSKYIYLDAPNLGEQEKSHLNKAVDAGYVSTAGPFVPEFEQKVSGYLGAASGVSTQSGTAAIHMALYELGIEEGDEVIVPSLTFIAAVNPIAYVRAKPIFVDVDPATWNIDPEDIKKKITKSTKAIVLVHLYGNPCAMNEIVKIAKQHNLHIIEDATESLGAKYGNRFTGTFGDLGCLSFNGNKIITTGGGGMIISDNTQRMEHIKFLINQARDESKGHYHPEIGFNYRMTNIEAALGLAQIEKLDEFLKIKKRFNRLYREELKDIKSICFQNEYQGAESSWWLTSVTFKDVADRARTQDRLKEKNIPTRRVFMPIVESPPYKSYKHSEYKNSYEIY